MEGIPISIRANQGNKDFVGMTSSEEQHFLNNLEKNVFWVPPQARWQFLHGAEVRT